MIRLTFDRLAFVLSVACLLAVTLYPAYAQEVTTEAEYAALMDAETGNLIYSKNGREPMRRLP